MALLPRVADLVPLRMFKNYPSEVHVKAYRCSAIRCAGLLLPLFFLASLGMAEEKKPNAKYACIEPNPAAMCTPANTCIAHHALCVDVKRTANSASATPNIPGAKGNSTFCVKVGDHCGLEEQQQESGSWWMSVKRLGLTRMEPSLVVPIGKSPGCEAPGMLQVFGWSLRIGSHLRHVCNGERRVDRHPLS